ncbi:MAG: hypothetical protein AAF527_03775 [Pseudomonadota bacterium]
MGDDLIWCVARRTGGLLLALSIVTAAAFLCPMGDDAAPGLQWAADIADEPSNAFASRRSPVINAN